MTASDGLLVVDKEAGWTSHDVVAKCRRVFGQRRVGHAGTLDPGATGVLLVGLGRVTRLMRFLGALPKIYEAEMVLGVSTTTLDAAGDVVERWDMSGVGEGEMKEAARAFLGEIDQVPPMVSAVKVGGRRLHEIARAGETVERPTRRVTVHRLSVEPTRDSGVWRLRIECSGGTYVRAIAADLGAALGGGAHLRSLRRLAVGSFDIGEASPVGSVGPGDLLSPAEALRDYPSLELRDEAAARVAHGALIEMDHVTVSARRAPAAGRLTGEGEGATGFAGSPAGRPGAAEEIGPWAVIDSFGRLLAVYELAGPGRLRPAVVLASRAGA